MNNPYSGYGKPVVGERLVGREHLASLITERLQAGSNIAIIGQPRIGKSSIAKEAVRRLRQQDKSLPIVWLPISTFPSSVELFNKLLDEIIEFLDGLSINPPTDFHRKVISLPSNNSWEAFYRCYRGLSLLCLAGIKTIIVLDEFDGIRLWSDARESILRFREMVHDSEKTGTTGVFISRRPLSPLELSITDISTLNGICETRYICPLDLNGLRSMFARAGDKQVLFNENEILEYSGGHPFLAEILLCHIYDLNSSTEGINQSIPEIFAHYKGLQKFLSDLDLFDQLLQATIGPRWSMRIESVEQLIAYGLMVKSDSEKIGYHGWSEHFQSYLEKSSRDNPALDTKTGELWHQTESALRDFIENVYFSAFGDNWMEIILNRHKSVKAIFEPPRESPEKIRDKEKKNFGNGASDRLLDYMYPMDYWTLINAEWPMFKDQLGNKEKAYWNERFTLLAKIRTPTMHSREHNIPKHVLITAQGYCEELLSLI